MTGYDPLIIFGIIVALALNFINGLTDAAQGVATVVATRALSPAKAVFLTGICNMAGPFIFTTAVAATIGTAIVHPAMCTPETIILAMLVSTSLVFCGTSIGLPLSSSHALIGGLVGQVLRRSGSPQLSTRRGTLGQVAVAGVLLGALIGAVTVAGLAAAFDRRFPAWPYCWGRLRSGACHSDPDGPWRAQGYRAACVVILFIFISPVLGAVTAFLFDVLISHLFKNSRQNRMKRIFSPLQIVACLFQATSHGANDGMHAVGVITALLVAAASLPFLPFRHGCSCSPLSPLGLAPVLAAGRWWTGWQRALRRSAPTRDSAQGRPAVPPLPSSRCRVSPSRPTM